MRGQEKSSNRLLVAVTLLEKKTFLDVDNLYFTFGVIDAKKEL